ITVMSAISVEPQSAPVNGEQLLQQVFSFLRQHLVCTYAHLYVLSLWVLHTYCCRAAPVTPYLHIRSREREAGKTVCIELLNVLCSCPWPATSLIPGLVLCKLQEERSSTLLLDNADTVLARCNPVVLGILNRGAHPAGEITIPASGSDGAKVSSVNVFSPKAFAGMRSLPAPIVAIC